MSPNLLLPLIIKEHFSRNTNFPSKALGPNLVVVPKIPQNNWQTRTHRIGIWCETTIKSRMLLVNSNPLRLCRSRARPKASNGDLSNLLGPPAITVLHKTQEGLQSDTNVKQIPHSIEMAVEVTRLALILHLHNLS